MLKASYLLLVVFGMHTAMAVSAKTMILTVCFNFGCKVQGFVQPTQTDIKILGNLFRDVHSAREEREQIRLAIASMEQIAARTLPTRNDVGGNYNENENHEGQQDCIDESKNTTTYLLFLDAMGWLKWHSVLEPVSRAPHYVDMHWAAQIREHDSKQSYVVDSWFYDNGQPPIIQKLEVWRDK